MAYSDSEGEDEPFQLARRRKKKKEEKEQAETGEDEKSDQEPAPHSNASAAVSKQRPKVVRAARLAIHSSIASGRRDTLRHADAAVVQCRWYSKSCKPSVRHFKACRDSVIKQWESFSAVSSKLLAETKPILEICARLKFCFSYST